MFFFRVHHLRILCKNNKYYSFRLNWVIWDMVEVFSVWPRIGFLNLLKQIRYFKLETVALAYSAC